MSKFKTLYRLFGVVVIVTAIPVTLFLVNQKTGYFSEAFGREAEILVDVSRTTSKQAIWLNLAQGGEGQEEMLSKAVDPITKLKPNYIRIDHIYDGFGVIGRTQTGAVTYNWQRLDMLVSDIQKTGAKPFFSLSYMPREFARTGNELDLPTDWRDWEDLVIATVEHYSGKDNMAIDGVYYEVWNEPDYFGSFRTYGDKNYLELYEHSVAGAQHAENVLDFKIGGPSLATFNERWLKAFFDDVGAQSLRLDFFSYHQYSEDVEDFVKDAIAARRLVNYYANLEKVELVVTESGFTSEKDVRYDQDFAAIHFFSVVAALQNRIDRLFTFEIKDGPAASKMHGGWGILTNEAYGEVSFKPRYLALDFLDQVDGDDISLVNDGTWVRALAKGTADTIYMLVVNYDKWGRHSEAVPITFINLPQETVTYQRIDFLGSSQPPRNLASTGGRLETVEYFSPNSASIIKLAF